jgi:hypothetical protein
MYRAKDIEEALYGVVGWEQSYDTDKQIEEELTETESGITFQQAHPLVTLENMESIMPEDFGKQFPLWSEGEWEKNDICKTIRNGETEYWKCLKDTTEEPTSESEDWKPYNILSAYLDKITRAGINSAVQNFIQQKQLNHETRNLLERRAFFDGAGRLRATINNTHKLCGFEIVPVRALGVTARIESIGLQMTGAIGKVKLYLFHSSQLEPLDIFEINIKADDGKFVWANVDWYLPYKGVNTNTGGAYYIVYDQDELPFGMQAINMNKDWSKDPCGSCTGYVDAENWKLLTKYLQITPIIARPNEDFSETPQLWDVAETMYTTTTSYGMNCIVSVGCDLTQFISEERLNFQSVIQKQVAVTALRTMAMNPNVRVNRNQSNVSKMDILYEIDGNTQGREGGIGAELKQAYKALNIDLKGIDRICLSCNNNGVKYRVV